MTDKSRLGKQRSAAPSRIVAKTLAIGSGVLVLLSPQLPGHAQTFTESLLSSLGTVTTDPYQTVFGFGSNGDLYGTTGSNIYYTTTAGGDQPSYLTVPTALFGMEIDGPTLDSANGNLYGVAQLGGTNNAGMIYEINGATNAVSVLTSLPGPSDSIAFGPLTYGPSGNIYGITAAGGSNQTGSIYEIPIGSSTPTVLASFTSATGSSPNSLVSDSNGNLYGTTGSGTVFEVAGGSSVITTLASLTGAISNPSSLIVDSSGNLFGIGRPAGDATESVFEVAANTHLVTTLATINYNGYTTLGLTMDSSGNIYGSMPSGGAGGYGSVFEVAAGTGAASTLATFTGYGGSATGYTPEGITIDSSGNLYGATQQGGADTRGDLYKLTLTTPQNFTWNGGGSNAQFGNSANWSGGAAPVTSAGDCLTLDGSAQLHPTLEQEYSAYSLTFAATAGAFTVGGANLMLGVGGLNQNSATNLETLANSQILLGAAQTWTIANGGLTVATTITGVGPLTIDGLGTLTLTGNNYDSGGFTMNGGGTVLVGDGKTLSGSLGSGNIYVNNDSVLQLNVASTLGSQTVSVNTGSALELAQNASAGNAIIYSQGQVQVYGAASLGSSTTMLNGSQSGLIFVNSTGSSAGATVVNNSTAGLGNGVDISQNSPAVAIGSLSGGGDIHLGSGTLTLGALGLNDTISGTITDAGIQNSTGGGLVKVGSGTLTLSGANTYTGSTTVEAGTLSLTGAGNYGTVISNAAGAILNIGNGSVALAQAINGGTINFTGGVTTLAESDSGSTLNVYHGATVIQTITGDPASVNIYGGEFSGSIENDDPTESLISIFGSDLTLTDPTLNGGDVDWTLEGTLADGDPLDVQYVVPGSNTSSAQGVEFFPADGSSVTPEPGALALGLPGSAFLLAFSGQVRRRQSQSKARKMPA